MTAYARDVVEGRVVAGKLVRQACERHLADLASGGERGLRFDAGAAQTAIDFFGLLKHSKGRWAGKAFELQAWQQFVVGSLWGWKRADGRRRFTVGHVEVGRKNGKSTLAAGVGLLLFLLDGEPGAEVYTVATKRDQARLTHEEAKRMVRAAPHLSRRVQVYKDNLSVPATASKYEPLGADADTLDGLNVSGAVCDEMHAWKQRKLYDVLETATGARDQPLFLIITTAGYDRHSIWWERRQAAIGALNETVPDDSLFAYIATLDEGDDWTDERVWIKANPSLGATVRLEELREKCDQAKAVPGKQNPFKRLRLNVPTDQAELWLPLEKWDACRPWKADEKELRGRLCHGGLDLSAVTDLTSLAWLFPPPDGDPDDDLWKLLVRFWLPREGLYERMQRDGVPYDEWASDGLITLTPGDVIDYEAVKKQVLADAEVFAVSSLAFDRYFANQLTLQLQDEGLKVFGFGQGFASMAAPVKEFETLVVSGRLAHGGNPVLRWQVANAAVKQDPAGNRKPDKKESKSRIDGLVAALMALGRAMGSTDSDDWYTPGAVSS